MYIHRGETGCFTGISAFPRNFDFNTKMSARPLKKPKKIEARIFGQLQRIEVFVSGKQASV